MNNKKATKRALLTSVMALVMCVAMLIGATFAWFTDTASTGINKIVSGNLEVDIIGANSASHIEKLDFTKATGAEGENLLWEPGCRYLTDGFRIANKGNLALKWKAEINKDNIVDGKAVPTAKDGKSLLDVIDFYVVTKAADGTETAVAIENFTGKLAANVGKSETYYIKGVMQTTAGNDYQDLTLDGITITVYATQDTVESDSYNNQYDKYAQYGERTVKDASSLTNATNDNVNTTNITYSFQAKNYEAGFYAQKFGVNSTFDGNGATFSGKFELNGGFVPTDNQESTLVVSNINVEGDLIVTAAGNNVIINNCTAKHISVLNLKDGVSVTIDNCEITGTPVSQTKGNNRYGIYITGVKDAEVEVNILNSSISGVASHAISVNGSGATFTFDIKGNHFGSYGLNDEVNRAAFKIWGDKTLGPNNTDPINEAASALAESMKEKNTFADDLGTNCVVAEFYANTVAFS